MRPGQVERRTHDYERHGVTTLFAALDVKAGTIVGKCMPRHRAREFRKFLDEVERNVPADLDIHVVMDNASSHKTKLAEAIRYALSRWDGLIHYLDDGRIEIDSNVVERSIRPIALNRKNALFAGSDGGGEHWAVIASLIETCKLCGAEPRNYLTDIITKIVNGHPNSQIDDLLPWGYSATPTIRHVA